MYKKYYKKIILAAYILLILSVFYHVYYAKKIIPGVVIGTVHVGGLTEDQALKILKEKDASLTKKLEFKYQDKTFEITGTQLGFNYDMPSSVSRAFEIGRTNNFFIDTKDKLVGLVKSLYLAPFYKYEEKILENELLRIKGDFSKSSEDAKFVLDAKNNFTISEAAEGYKISGKELKDSAFNAFNNFDYGPITLPVVKVTPVLESKDIQPLFDSVKKLVFKEFKIYYDGTNWNLTPSQKLELLAFDKGTAGVKVVINKPTFDAFINLIRQDVDVLPRGNAVTDEKGNVTSFELTKEGKELDIKKFSQDFKQAFLSDATSITVATLPISNIDKDKYGIFALLGEGSSKFEGSSNARIHNLTLAAKKTNGVLVPPDGIYSLNKSIGAINAATGYYTALVISGGRTVLGEGGGVCQTSTTLFRAVLNAGLPVVMRYAHDYRVHYYEIDGPIGLDAAIYQPSLDFQFKNDTPNYILVQSYPNVEENSLTFKIYGTPDGRTVEISEPIVTGMVAPPATLYQDDPTLAKGVIRQVDWSAWGSNVSFTRTVKRDNTVISQDSFVSRYQPWRAIFLVGTKL